MAAGQQKKRLSSSNLHEQYKGKKKKKLDTSDYMLSLRPHIHLEWDHSKKQALAKKEQVGITWKDMSPFLDYVPQRRSGLADVLSIPGEIFGLENLKEVLSYEVWENCLSESERNLLTQFLPSGTDADQAVHSLLTGEDHHFGNPFLKWSSSLCSGDLHPDNILHMDRQFRTDKKAYYSELNQYHTEMIEVLKKWKETWARCKDPEKLRRGSSKLKRERPPILSEKAKVATNSKKEIPHKICVRNDDTAKYMSYIKISKQQFELVKNLKNGGDGIQSKSLDRVIGDISDFSIHPYEGFGEEEKKRLHKHWLLVVRKDIPAAFQERRGKALRKEEWGKCLEQELADKRIQIMDKMEMENLDSSPQRQIEDEELSGNRDDMVHEYDTDSSSNSSDDSCMEINPVDVDQGVVVQDIHKPADNCVIRSKVMHEEETSKNDMEPRLPVPSAKYTWQDGSMQVPNYLNSESHRLSFGGLSLRQPQSASERPTRVIDFDREILEHEAEESIASALHVDSTGPLLYPYAGQNHDELLPPFPKEPAMLSAYPHEHMNDLKQPGLDLLMANESLPHSGQFAHNFQQHPQLIEQRHHSREQEMFMHQVMNKNMYANGRFPNQGHMPVVSHGLVALQPPLNGGLATGQNWFPQEQRAHGGWSGIESNGGGQSSGDGGVDGSLFSVLSGCRNIPSRAPFGNPSSEQFMQARNFVRGGIPTNNGIYGYAPQQVRSSNSHNIAANPRPTDLNMPWLNYPHPNSSMHDSNSKPFMGSWKQ